MLDDAKKKQKEDVVAAAAPADTDKTDCKSSGETSNTDWSFYVFIYAFICKDFYASVES